MDVFSDYSLVIHVVSGNLREAWGASGNSRIGVVGQPESIQTDEGGEWANDVWADSRPERRIKFQFQGLEAHSWILERRNSFARGAYGRVVAADRLSGERILAEAQWRLNSLISGGWCSAY